jgi:hypothetical protein
VIAVRRRIAPAAARRPIRDAGRPTWQGLTAIVLAATFGAFVYGRHRIPARFLLWQAIQELLLPIFLLLVVAIGLALGWR